MKNIIIGFLLACLLGVGIAAIHVPETACFFFSARGMTAQSLVILDQLNLIRSKLPTPLAAIPTNAVIQAIQDKMDTLAPFESETNRPWMR